MSRRAAVVAMVVVGLGLARASAAQSLDEKQQRKEEERILQDAVDDMNQACKTKVKPSWDWKGFGGKLVEQSNHVGSNCGIALEAMRRLCNGDAVDAPEAFARQIKTVVCKGGAPETTVALSKGKLVVTTSANQKRAGARDFVAEFLLANLSGRTAPTLGEEQQRKAEDAILRGALDEANRACKTKLKTSWEWKSFGGALVEQSNHVGSNCGIALEAIAGMCHGDADVAPRSIAAGIDTVLCKGGVEETTVELKGRTLVVSTRPMQKRGGAKTYVAEFLQANLK